jgi:hypothetical protein
MRRSFADLLYGSTTYFTRAIPFKITILVNFFKDGLSFQGRPPHPPARGVRLPQFSRWRRLTNVDSDALKELSKYTQITQIQISEPPGEPIDELGTVE